MENIDDDQPLVPRAIDFAIRSVVTGDLCPIEVSKNEVVLRGKDGKALASHIELEKINLTGRFP